MKKKRVVIAMSGGIDSSVSALILKDAGYDVIGISMQVWDQADFKRSSFGGCCSIDDLYDARSVAYQLGIPYYVINFEDVFKYRVVDYFINEYLEGKTPNPCIKCNSEIKFKALLKKAEELDAQFIATGHYARKEYDSHFKRYKLLKGVDRNKDQSYFLFSIKEEVLEKIIFPVGNLTKSKVREIARKNKLKVADKQESQEICFIPDNNYRNFINKYAANQKIGDIIDFNGKVLGKHNGYFNYTIGQRKGLGISSKEPLYVISIIPAENKVVAGSKKNLESSGLTAEDCNFFGLDNLKFPLQASMKCRYKMSEFKGEIFNSNSGEIKIKFEKAQYAVAPGQAVVFYNGDEVTGGGWIKEAFN